MKITEQVRAFSQPIVENLGCSLWDVEYVREGSEWFLRLYIDKESGVGIEDCEAVSRAVDPVLDEKDIITEGYHFEVSSAGLERSLKKEAHFAVSMGMTVLVKLYTTRNGSKEILGTLMGYDNGVVTLQTPEETIILEKSAVALVRRSIEV